MKYDEFLRKFKANKDSWKCIKEVAQEKERAMQNRYTAIIKQLQKFAAQGRNVNIREINN